jgi:2-polyprenyl-3-methyl-5-hydroxy-6-metoxy-1,4-benzoquinol methylase
MAEPGPAPRADPDAPAACVLCGGTRRTTLFAKGGWDFVRCTGCGLVAIHPLPTRADLARHHDASYADGRYADFAAAEALRTAIARHRLADVRGLAPAGPWLDVGASTGTFVAVAAAAGLDVEGLELSTVAVERARERGLPVRLGAIEDFAPERRYAVVTAFDVVEHVPDPVDVVRRLGGWLAPGGVLALTLPSIASLAARVLGRHWYYYAAPDHLHYFTPATIRRLLERAGLGVLAVRPATKPLTLDYAAANLERFEPRLGRLAGAAVAWLPAALRTRLVPLPIGEMLVLARGTTGDPMVTERP